MTSSEGALRVGLCGLGTVGQGLAELLRVNAARIERQAGRPVVLTRVASRTAKPDVALGRAAFSTDLMTVLNADDVDVVVELIGGSDTALDIAQHCLKRARPLVTANKALLALHGAALQEQARSQGVGIGFEAAVAGGIPIINALQEGLGGNRVDALAGIINGTCNFILTAMAEEQAEFAAALAQAQALGYAEADPSFDVGGIDAAHKLAVLAALVFGQPVAFDDLPVRGIEQITAEDIEYARQLGYVIKHLAVARRGSGPALEARVEPALVPQQAPLAGVHGVTNAVLVQDNAVGTSMYTGPGAGALPTAASVVADLIRVARGTQRAQPAPAGTAQLVPLEHTEAPFYLRIPVLDQPGVLAELANVLSGEGISIESVIQREQAVRTDAEANWVPVVLLTRQVSEQALQRALAGIAARPDVVGEVMSLRVETLAAL